MTYFAFKERVDDFIVEEILAEPAGTGDFHYVFFEKRNLATFDVINQLQAQFGFNRNMIGIAGLKDKQGVTRQWMTFPKRDVQKLCGGINKLLEFLRALGRVVTATYGDHMLKLGENKGNSFKILLRSLVRKDFDKMSAAVDRLMNQIQKEGIPNYFGQQRFGNQGRNRQTGEKLVLGEIRSLKGDNNTMVEKRFKVQAFASYLFNAYLDIRIKKGKINKIIPGDVIVAADGRTTFRNSDERDNTERMIVTGPVLGDDLKDAQKEALKLETELYQKFELPKNIKDGFKKFSLFGIRRPLMLYPADLTWKRTKDRNLMVSFSLSSGAYASVVIEWLETQLKTSI